MHAYTVAGVGKDRRRFVPVYTMDGLLLKPCGLKGSYGRYRLLGNLSVHEFS